MMSLPSSTNTAADMAENRLLVNARLSRGDEFHTRLEDIGNEMCHYRAHFKNKVVYCNCDDPEISNFYRWFRENYAEFRLRGLICSFHEPRVPELLGGGGRRAYHVRYDGRTESGPHYFIEDGDFRSAECIGLMRESDIVVTNPPFSLFREHVHLAMEHARGLLVLGNQNVLATHDMMDMLMEDRIRMGPSIRSGGVDFIIPEGADMTARRYRIDDAGRRYVNLANIRWLTTLEHGLQPDFIPLRMKYSPDDYRMFDNYAAMNVDRTCDIPGDYGGVMGVPITFLSLWNRDQFDLLGVSDRVDRFGLKIRTYTAADHGDWRDLNAGPVVRIGGRLIKKYRRVFIRNRHCGPARA